MHDSPLDAKDTIMLPWSRRNQDVIADEETEKYL